MASIGLADIAAAAWLIKVVWNKDDILSGNWTTIASAAFRCPDRTTSVYAEVVAACELIAAIDALFVCRSVPFNRECRVDCVTAYDFACNI